MHWTEWAAGGLALLLLLVGPGATTVGQSLNESAAQPGPGIAARLQRDEQDLDITVYVDGKNVSMKLEEYVAGVVAAEMPAAYPVEALKAQAIAARTLVYKQLRANGGSGCARHGGADVCANFGHCQAFLDGEAMKANWGAQYQTYRDKIAGAVEDTRGLILTYEDQPITVFYHSMSVGRTEEVQTVFAESLPYYRSVSSAADPSLEKYEATMRLGRAEAAALLNDACPGAGLTAQNIAGTFKILSQTEAGRVDQVQVGDKRLNGVAVRRALSLNSTDFTLAFTDEQVLITTHGSGHGVGMSQVGARMMAEEGAGYRAILSHYYPGTEILEMNV